MGVFSALYSLVCALVVIYILYKVYRALINEAAQAASEEKRTSGIISIILLTVFVVMLFIYL
jgi:hypothetical protein